MSEYKTTRIGRLNFDYFPPNVIGTEAVLKINVRDIDPITRKWIIPEHPEADLNVEEMAELIKFLQSSLGSVKNGTL